MNIIIIFEKNSPYKYYKKMIFALLQIFWGIYENLPQHQESSTLSILISSKGGNKFLFILIYFLF